jgi:4-amino-4-deoxy-L-arabinose transferase-like glycosyltransferase
MSSPRRVWIRRDGGIGVAELPPPPHDSSPQETTDLNGGNGRVNGYHHSGNGHAWPPGQAPLWFRLSGLTVDGSASTTIPGPAHARSASAVRRWLHRLRSRVGGAVVHRPDLAVQLVLLTGVGIVLATNMLHWPAVLFDEGTYVGNAWAVQHRGALAFYTYTYGHPPLGWMMITLWTWASGLFGNSTYSLDHGRELMFVVSLVSCSLLYTLARRIQINRFFAASAVLMFALSPLSIYFHRGVLLDNLATAWALAAFVLALSPRRRLWSFAASGACFAVSVLSKETTLVLLPALLLAAYQNTDARTRRYCLTVFISFLVLIGLCYPLYATLKGELVPGRGHVSLLGTELNMVFGRKGTGSVFDVHSVAHGTVAFWLFLDPWLVGAALVLSPIALALRNTRAMALAYLIQVVMILRPGYLPAMYVIALLPFGALIVAGTSQAVWRVASQRGPGLPPLRTAVAVLASAAALAAEAAVAALVVAPRWNAADRAAMTVRLDGTERQAERWIARNIPHDKRLIVTDDFWLYLIQHGFDSHPMSGGFSSRTVVSYWPLDKDPAVRRHFPQGWRDFDYVVSTEAMRDTADNTPNTQTALHNSRTVATFGRGVQRIEIRAIERAHAPG